MMNLKKYFRKCRRSMAVLLLLSMVLQSTIAYADVDDFTASPSEVEEVVGEDDPNNSATPSVTGSTVDEDDDTPDLTEYPEEPEENNPVGASSASPSDAEEAEGNETPIEEPEDEEIASPSNALGGLGFAMENEGGELLGAPTTTPNYLTFTSKTASSTVCLDWSYGTNVEYNKNNTSWISYTANTSISLGNNETVSFKGKNVTTTATKHFTITGTVEASGSVTSLTDENGGDSSVTLSNDCYMYMFSGCTGLVSVPALPAVNLSSLCYHYMFKDCTGLISIPTGLLPATTLNDACYHGMFKGCSNLTSVPADLLPATTATERCYYEMFSGCSKLIQVPNLPATTLSDQCYFQMFAECDEIVLKKNASGGVAKAWIIPVSLTSASEWNEGMFEICDNVELDGSDGTTCKNNKIYYTFNDPNYLTFIAKEDGSGVTFKYASSAGTFEYSLDDGNTWTSYTEGIEITLNNNQKASFRRNGARSTTNPVTNYSKHFEMTGKIVATGSVTSLIDKYGNNPSVTLGTNDFACMFIGCTALQSVPGLSATGLANNCYQCMFKNCTSLTSIPNDLLPATILKEYCYAEMFSGCSNLINAPLLPAASVSKHCYDCMFFECSKLTSAPATLPALDLTSADSCYFCMFKGCSELTTAPSLPATILAVDCYANMFDGCSKLVTIPDILPAMSLTDDCYQSMFSDCSLITIPPTLPATTLAGYCYYGMFNNCTSLVLNKTATTTRAKEWKIPVTSTTASDWNTDMFAGCTYVDLDGSNGKDCALNTTYYTVGPGYYVTKHFNDGGTTADESVIIASGSTFAKPADPTYGAYTFDGWYTAASGGTEYTSWPLTITATTDLYAHWSSSPGPTPTTWTVTLHYQNPTTTSNHTVNDGGTYALPTTPTWIGHTFIGWFNAASGGTQYINLLLTITSDTDVYAHWNANTHTVSFNTYGGSSVANQTVNDGATATRPSTNPTKSGYTFDNWYTDSTYATIFDFTTTITADKTIHAKWNAVTPAPTPSSGSSGNGGGGGGGGSVSPAGKTLDPQIVSPGIVTNPLDPIAVVDPTLLVQQVVIPPTPVPTETKIQVNYDINAKKKVEVIKNPSVGHDDSGNAKLNLTGMDGVTYIADFGFYDVETKNAVTNYGGHIDTYYVNEASNLVSGWIETANKNRYFMENVKDTNEGKMCHGWKRIVSDWYFFDNDGHMLKAQQTMDGFTVDGEGKMTNPSLLDRTLINGIQQNIVYTMNKGYQHN